MKKLLTTILILVCLASSALATKLIPNGSTSQSITVVITDANGDPNTTPATIADLDIYCQKDGVGAMSTKIDLVALADTQTAWTSGRAIHQGQGLYRIDIPDANLSDGIGTLLTYLIVDAAGSNRAVYYEVQLTDPITIGDANTALVADIAAVSTLVTDGNTVIDATANAVLTYVTDSNTVLDATINSALTYVTDSNTVLDATVNSVLTYVTDSNTVVDATVELIVADTDELQTDWANGGRLDTILDAVNAAISGAVGSVGRYASMFGPAPLLFIPSILLLLLTRKGKRNEK